MAWFAASSLSEAWRGTEYLAARIYQAVELGGDELPAGALAAETLTLVVEQLRQLLPAAVQLAEEEQREFLSLAESISTSLPALRLYLGQESGAPLGQDALRLASSLIEAVSEIRALFRYLSSR